MIYGEDRGPSRTRREGRRRRKLFSEPVSDPRSRYVGDGPFWDATDLGRISRRNGSNGNAFEGASGTVESRWRLFLAESDASRDISRRRKHIQGASGSDVSEVRECRSSSVKRQLYSRVGIKIRLPIEHCDAFLIDRVE